jgi:PKD repeat protein
LRNLLRPVPGNHEYNTSGATGYYNYFKSISVGTQFPTFGKGWYSFDVGTWHIIGLNSSDGCQKVSCAAGSEQETWLKHDLAATSQPCILAFWHHALSTAPAERPMWQDMYDAGVDFVLAGHVHSYRAPRAIDPNGNADANGPREVIVGTGGKDGGTYGLLKLTLHANSADWTFVGTTSNSGSATCHGSTPPPPPPPPPPPAKPQANFTFTTTDLTASFTYQSEQADAPTGIAWDFGDGSSLGDGSDPVPDPTHTYKNAGTYTVKLTVTNLGGSTTTTQKVTLTAPSAPVADQPGPQPQSQPQPQQQPQPPSPLAVTDPGTAPTPVDPPAAPVTVLAQSSPSRTLTAERAVAVVRRALTQRLKRWTITAVTCRIVRTGSAACSFAARTARRRAMGTGTVRLPAAGGATQYRLRVRLTGAHTRSTVWSNAHRT